MAISKVVKNLFRSREILSVFFRHGFGDLMERMGLAYYFESEWLFGTRKSGEPPELKTSPMRFREALEELGGAFVKLGQLMSVRPDVLPISWIRALVPLQDHVTAVPFEDLRLILEEDLGQLDEKFESIDATPLAAGSVAQVHSARIVDGREMVIKIRKPSVKKKMLQDCDILEALAEILEKHVPESRPYRPVDLVDEFRHAVTLELDFTREGQNLDYFRSNFSDTDSVTFPAPHWDCTTERVLTMEMIKGVKISLIDELIEHGTDTSAIADNLAEALLRQILEHGFVHGDPHPGNIVVLENGGICFLDCGMVASLDEAMKENLLLLLSAGIGKDMDLIADILIDMNAMPADLDRQTFLREGALFLARYHSLPLKRVSLKAIVEEITGMINKFRIRVPSELLIVAKALVSLEDLGKRLNPDFDAVAKAEPIVRMLVLKTYGPTQLGRKFVLRLRDLHRFARELTSDLRVFSRTLRNNELRVVVEHRGLSEAFKELDRATRRLSFSVVMGSLILGSSIVILAASEPLFKGIPVLGLIGLGISAVMGLWMAISTLRRG